MHGEWVHQQRVARLARRFDHRTLPVLRKPRGDLKYNERRDAVHAGGEFQCDGNDFSKYLPLVTVRDFLFEEVEKASKGKNDTVYEFSKLSDFTTRTTMQYYLVTNLEALSQGVTT